MKHLFLFLLLICTAFSLQSQHNYNVASIPSEFTKNANGVVIHENTTIDIVGGTMIIEEERAITVLNERGDRFVDAVAYHDETRKVIKIEAYLYNALGYEVEHFRRNDFKDVSVADGVSIFNDNRALYLNYTPTSYPYTIVFKCKTETSDTAFVYPWFPVNHYALSVMHSERTINFEPSNKVRFKKENFEDFDIKSKESEVSLNFKAINIEAFKYEEHAPSFEVISPKVYFGLDRFSLQGVPGYGKDWEEFGKWMYRSLLTNVSELPDGTKKMIRALVASETTNEGKARKVYQFVQDKVRYISVQIGIGGWKPMLASDVDNLSYGDCKALTNYTKALLDEVGVPSYYTIINAGDNEKDIMSDFSSMQGNHAILGVENGDDITWLECTSQDKPYGFMGNFTDDRDVLIITPEGGKIVHTKIYTQEENSQKNTASIIVKNDGSASASITVVSEGLQYDGKYNFEKLRQDEQMNEYKNRWSNLNGLTIEEIKLSNNKEKIVFTEEVKLSMPSITSKVGDDMLLELNSFNQSGYIPPRISERKQKLELGMAYSDIDEVLITLPENFKFDSLPEDKTLETKFGSYTLKVESIDENKIKYNRVLLMNKETFPAEDYQDYRSFRRAIVKLDKTKILLKPTN